MSSNPFAHRFDKLSEAISLRIDPLGVGMKNQCFAGLAFELARQENAELVPYYGKTLTQWKAAIKANNECAASQRNSTMLAYLNRMKSDEAISA